MLQSCSYPISAQPLVVMSLNWFQHHNCLQALSEIVQGLTYGYTTRKSQAHNFDNQGEEHISLDLEKVCVCVRVFVVGLQCLHL